MATKPPLRPGTPAPASGQYGILGPRGGKIDGEVTAIKGKPMPPTDKPGQCYVLVDPSDNGSGKAR